MSEPTVQPPCSDLWHSRAVLTRVMRRNESRRALLAGGVGTCIADLTFSALAPGSPLQHANSAAKQCGRGGRADSVATGVEDPRLVRLRGRLFTTLNTARAPSATRSPPSCAQLASQRQVSLSPLQPLGAASPLRWEASPSPTDRNWLLFEHSNGTYAIFSVEPHTVLLCERGEENGRAEASRGGQGKGAHRRARFTDVGNGLCQLAHRTSSAALRDRFRGFAVHGGANPLLVRTSGGVPLYYVAIFHTKDADLQYANYAYSFAPRPPFEVLSVARSPLSLRGKRVRMVTGLTEVGVMDAESGEALLGISYGVDDRAARFALLPLTVLLADTQTVGDGRDDATAATVDASELLRLPREAAAARPVARGDAAEYVSAAAIGSGRGACSISHGVRFDAASIKVTPAASPADCCALCRATKYCHFFTFAANGDDTGGAATTRSPHGAGRASTAVDAEPSGGLCWLKQWSGTAVPAVGHASGTFSREAACGCELIAASRLEESPLLAEATARSPAACAPLCLRDVACAGFDWAPSVAWGGGVCRLRRRPPVAHFVPLPAAVAGGREETAGVVRLKRRLLLVHNHPPHLGFGSDRRLLALAQALVDSRFHLLFVGADAAGKAGRSQGRAQLLSIGVELVSAISEVELTQLATKHDVSVVILTLWFWGASASMPARYLRMLRTSLPHLKIVVMTDDVHHLRQRGLEARAASTRGVALRTGAEAEEMKEEELSHYYHADHVLTISDVDRGSILQSLRPGRRIHPRRFSTLRHVFGEAPHFPLASAPPFRDRRNALFVGNMNNPTNVDGLTWFADAVMPLLLQRQPSFRLRVVGSWAGGGEGVGALRRRLESLAAVDLLGYIDDVGSELRSARLLVVPIRWATGILTKQTLAHVHGLPTAITPAAAAHAAPEPIDPAGFARVWSHRQGGYDTARVAAVGDTAAAFAAAVLHLHGNASAWVEISAAAARFAKSGGGGQGVCPEALRRDVEAFWAVMEETACFVR